MRKTWVIFYLMVISWRFPVEAEEEKLVFQVLRNQRELRELLLTRLLHQAPQDTRQWEELKANTTRFLQTMRGAHKNLSTQLQTMPTEDSAVLQLEQQLHVKNFLEHLLDAIELSSRWCRRHVVPTPPPVVCALESRWPTECAEVEPRTSGVTSIGGHQQRVLVTCDQDIAQGGWTEVLHRRIGGRDFSAISSEELGFGFGAVCSTEFFVGLRLLHDLTSARRHQLLLELKNQANRTVHAHYDEVVIGGRAEDFRILRLGDFRGDAGDFLRPSVGRPFSFTLLGSIFSKEVRMMLKPS